MRSMIFTQLKCGIRVLTVLLFLVIFASLSLCNFSIGQVTSLPTKQTDNWLSGPYPTGWTVDVAKNAGANMEGSTGSNGDAARMNKIADYFYVFFGCNQVNQVTFYAKEKANNYSDVVHITTSSDGVSWSAPISVISGTTATATNGSVTNATATGGNALTTSAKQFTLSISGNPKYVKFQVITDGNSYLEIDGVEFTGTSVTMPTITTTPASRCGTGAVPLGAAASVGTVNWYAAATGGTSLGTGTSFTTPEISTSTTYYVDGTNGSCVSSTRTPITATVAASPSSVSAGSNVAICSGNSTSLAGSAVSPSVPGLPVYASSGANSTVDTDIGTVVLNSITTTGTPASITGTNTNNTSIVRTLVPGTEYTINVTTIDDDATTYSHGVAVFIDYNRDGDFSDANETVYSQNGQAAPGLRNKTFTVPSGLTPGDRMMRVVAAEGYANPPATGTYSWGETENYTIRIGEILTYAWTSSPVGFTSSSQNPGSVSPTTTTTYTLTASFGVCTATNSVAVTVYGTPTVTTTEALSSSIGNFSATAGGNVTSEGSSSVTARGVVWGTSPSPTMPSASSTSNDTGAGSFTSSITGLSASTVYYYRAYAVNTASSSCGGYSYGIEYSFVTTGPSAEGYYISGNIVNNGEIISTFDENYLRLTGTSKTITGSGKFTNSKLFADGSTTFNADLNAASAFTETFVNAGKSLTIATGRTFKNGTMGNYGTLTIDGTGIINNTSNWVNGATGTVTFGGAGTIYAGANWTNDGTFTAATGTVEFNGSTSGNTINGTTAFYKATINKGSSTATILDVNGTVTQTNILTFTNGLLRIPTGGSWTKTGNGPTIGATSGLHVNGGTFTQNGASVTNDGLFKTTTGTATIGNSSGNSITNQSGSSFIIDGAGTVNIAGRLEATGSGSFNQSAGTLNVCTSGNGLTAVGSIDLSSGTSFTMTGGAINMVQKSTGSTQIDYKNLAGTVSISGGTLTIGTTATSASSNFNIQGAMPPLVVNNTTNAKTATINGASTLYGNVTINSTSSLVLNSGVTATVNGSLSNSGIYNATGTLNLAGDWTNNGTFTSNAGNTVSFNGGIASTISGSGTDNFQNLTITKTNSTPLLEVTLGKDATVLGTLTLTNGKLIVSGTKTLFVGNTSANGEITGGSTSSYIVAYDNGTTIGKLQRAINTVTSYVFPIGDLSNYAPVNYTLVSGTLSSANLSVYTKPVRISAMNIGLQTYLNRYWDVTPTGISGSTYNISYNYADGDINSGGNEANLLPVKLSGGVWYRPTESLFQTGVIQGSGSVTANSNLLTWTGLTTYSVFGGAGNQAVILPVDLVLFTGACVDRKNILKWESFTEMNNDYYTIENTIDGISYEEIGTVDGAGNTSEINAYELVHENYRNAINYYRLKQTDFDGSSKYSELISIDNRSGANEKEIVSITNLLGQEINEHYKGLVIVTFTDGSSVKRIQ